MKKIVLLLALLASFNAFASEVTGNVIDIRVTSSTLGSNLTHVKTSGSLINQAQCTNGQWWTMDTDTEQGKSFLSVLLAAKMASRPVTIWGTGTCHNGMEYILQVGLQ